jgi:hypothetical protein
MFGTIGRARPKPGVKSEFDAAMQDWMRDIRPKIPGHFLEMTGKSVDHPDEVLFIALAQDEATYRKLAEMPEQHAFFERMSALMDGDIRWEDVEMQVSVDD